MDYRGIGKRIRVRRKALGLSQEQLAERIDISNTHMSHIETGGTKLSLPVLVSIANALSCGVDELLADCLDQCAPAVQEDIARELQGCTGPQLRVLADILHAAKSSIDKNL